MTKQTLAILIVAVVFAAGAAVAIASSIGGDDSDSMPNTTHQMDNGEMMNMDR